MSHPPNWPIVGLPQPIAKLQTHVWAWRLDSFPGAAGFDESQIWLLDADEKARFHRYHFERDRLRFAITHLNVRRILSAYLGLAANALSFRANPFGKPAIAPVAQAGQLYFNVSHSRNIALLAISAETEVGVDVEDVRPIEPEVAERYFSPAEQTALASLGDEAWLNGFYRCWTRKEAILKAEGVGLQLPLSSFDVSLLPGVPAKLLGVRPPATFRCPWTLHDLATPSGTVAALATGSPDSEIVCFCLGESFE